MIQWGRTRTVVGPFSDRRGLKLFCEHVLDNSLWEFNSTGHSQCLNIPRYDPLHLFLLVRGNEEDHFNIPLPRLESPVRKYPRVGGKDLYEAGSRRVAVIIHRPTLVPKVWGKVIELVRRVDEDGPVVDKPKGLTFLLPGDIPLDIDNCSGALANDVDVPKGEERLANLLCEREDAAFQTVGVQDALSYASNEAVARRILVHGTHSALLMEGMSVLVKLASRRI